MTALLKEFDDLIRALQNCQIPVFKEILDGKNGKVLLTLSARFPAYNNALMTPMMVACRYFHSLELFQAFFDCIRKNGGDEVLKTQLTRDAMGRVIRSNFIYALLRGCDPKTILFILGTIVRLDSVFKDEKILFNQLNTDFKVNFEGEKEKSAIAYMSGSKYLSMPEMVKVRAITCFYLDKFNLLEIHVDKNCYGIPQGIASAAVIRHFEKKIKQEAEQFAWQQRVITQEVKEEQHDEDVEMASRVNLESKVRIMQRELEVERRALANEKSAHEVTREQLRIALKLADSAAGTRRRREEDDDEEAAAAASLKATRRVKKTT